MEMNKQAGFSTDKKHRYWLLRSWEDSPKMLLIIGASPQCEDVEESYINHCIHLAKYNGFGGIVICNLFTYIASTPKELIANINNANDRVSHETLRRMIANTSTAVCAWGNLSFMHSRIKMIMELLNEPYCFGRNADGSPTHPQYIDRETSITPY